MGLHILRCPEHDWTILRKYLSVGRYVCLQNFVDTVSQELMLGNWWNFILLEFDIIWCWLDFCVYCSTSNAAMENFPPNFGILISLILMPRISPNLLSNIHILRKYVDWQKIFGANQLTGGAGRLYFPRISSYL